MINYSDEQIAELKGNGFILMKDKEHFTCRIVFVAGVATADELNKVSEISKRFANGEAIMTVRLNMEVPGIKAEDIAPMMKALDEAGLCYGGTGAKVRPVVTCKGTVCKWGLIDTQELCRELHNEFYPQKMPHKFKINITGCPNNCAKAQLADVGFMGAPKNMVRVSIGGRSGRLVVLGDEICRIPVSKAKDATRLCMDFFAKFGKTKQRFADLLTEMKETPEYNSLVESIKALAN